jgi:hypothetical protein
LVVRGERGKNEAERKGAMGREEGREGEGPRSSALALVTLYLYRTVGGMPPPKAGAATSCSELASEVVHENKMERTIKWSARAYRAKKLRL